MQYANSPYAKKNARMTKWIFAVVVAGAVIFLGFQTYVYIEQTRGKRAMWHGEQQAIPTSNWEVSLKIYQKLAAANPSSNIVFSPLVLDLVVADLSQKVPANSSRQITKVTDWDGSRNEDILIQVRESKNSADISEELSSHLKGTNMPRKRFRERNLDNKDNNKNSTSGNETTGISMRSFVTNITTNHVRGFSKSGLYPHYGIVSYVSCEGPREMDGNKSINYPGKFHISKNKTVILPMMHRVGYYRTVDNDLRYKLIEFPGPTPGISLILVVPRGGVDMHEVESSLSVSLLKDGLQKATRTKTEVHMPQFKAFQVLKLSEVLSYLGTFESVSKNGTTVEEKPSAIFNDWAFESSFLDLDQAQTNIIAKFNDTEVKQQLFRVNRPFLFIAYDEKRDTILFMGKYIGENHEF